MFWFYLVDNQQTHHHEYFTHWPLLYVGIGLLGFCVLRLKRKVATLMLAFCAGALLHMVLDSIAAPMYWLAPFSSLGIGLVEVPATQSHWILSFLFHWTFLSEILICLAALIVMIKFPNKAH